MDHIRENLLAVEERLDGALARAGRRREEVTLIAVTKTFAADVTIAAYNAGLRVFGENYVQEFEQKAPLLAQLEGAQYHLIGHLQSNKVNKATPLFHCIQTVDSAKLAQRLQQSGRALEVMVEVKLSEEGSKQGCAPEDLAALVDSIRAMPGLSLQGLMTMAPFFDDPEQSRPYFARLRAMASAHHLPALSMGMSNDFEVAVEEGATHIRLGTVLFGKRSPRP
ncbi:MAG: YggS family pyridoxal phosphate-dependent enzyme [Bryobacterales bacterium]|nr:YggS family pyridoxal phosphate-dependent enzyme [Bryobacterales bacterium]